MALKASPCLERLFFVSRYTRLSLRPVNPACGSRVVSSSRTVASDTAANGFVTVLNSQTVGGEIYLDAARQPGRVIGLKPAS